VLSVFREDAIDVIQEYYKNDEVMIDKMQPLYSIDNATVHTDVPMVICPTDLLHVPPNSPDMHKVVEHIFNCLMHRLKHRVFPAMCEDHKHNPMSIDRWIQVVLAELELVATPEAIRADIATLPDTYRYIVEHGGEFCPRPLN